MEGAVGNWLRRRRYLGTFVQRYVCSGQYEPLLRPEGN